MSKGYMKTKTICFKQYVLDYIRGHSDYYYNHRLSNGQLLCTIQLVDDPMYYSRDFDVPSFIVEDDSDKSYYNDYFYKIVEPEIIKGLSISKKHAYEKIPFQILLDERLFEL